MQVRKNWDCTEALARLTEATEDKEKLQAEAERLSWMNEVLEELNPQEGEWKKISDEHAMLSNSADILTNVEALAIYAMPIAMPYAW